MQETRERPNREGERRSYLAARCSICHRAIAYDEWYEIDRARGTRECGTCVRLARGG